MAPVTKPTLVSTQQQSIAYQLIRLEGFLFSPLLLSRRKVILFSPTLRVSNLFLSFLL